MIGKYGEEEYFHLYIITMKSAIAEMLSPYFFVRRCYEEVIETGIGNENGGVYGKDHFNDCKQCFNHSGRNF